MRSKLFLEIEKELKDNVDLEYKAGAKRYFKEKIVIYGVRTPIVRKISAKYFQKVKDLDKKQIFKLCEELLMLGYGEYRTIAFSWAGRLKKDYDKSDFITFERWLKKYVSNWGACDSFCTGAFGELIVQYPELIPRVKKWNNSKNRWLRRASAVIFIPLAKEKKYLSHIFKTADKLLMDSDDLVQKGYGWMLKITSDSYQKQVFDYVMSQKHRMPRTSLRYAIEKMPKNLKQKAMS